MTEEETIELIRRLWSSRTFAGAFGGISTVRHFLKTEKNISVSRRLVAKALHSIKEYTTTLARRQTFQRRQYQIRASRQLGQFDLAFIPHIDRGFKGFFILQGVYLNIGKQDQPFKAFEMKYYFQMHIVAKYLLFQ